MSIRTKLILYFCITSFIITAFMGVAIYFITQNLIDSMANTQMDQVAELVEKMAKTSYESYQDKVNKNLPLADYFLTNKCSLDEEKTVQKEVQSEVTDKIKTITIPAFLYEGKKVDEKFPLPDKIAELVGGRAVSIFQIIPDGLLCISSSIRKSDGSRATDSYITTESKIYQSIKSGNVYTGRVMTAGEWFITAYKPVYDKNHKLIGAVSIGVSQENLDILRDKILSTKIGESGYPFIMDSTGLLIFHRTEEGKNIGDRPHIMEMIEKKNGQIFYKQTTKGAGQGKIKNVHYKYLPEMDWIIASGTYSDEFYRPLYIIRNVMIGLVIILILFYILIAIIISSHITTPLTDLTSMLRNISEGHGDLTLRLRVISNDEIGLLAKSFNTFTEKLQGMIKEISHHTASLLSTSEELSQATSHIMKQSAAIKQINEEDGKKIIHNSETLALFAEKLKKIVDKFNI